MFKGFLVSAYTCLCAATITKMCLPPSRRGINLVCHLTCEGWWFELVCSWLIFGYKCPCPRLKRIPFSISLMAATSSNKMQILPPDWSLLQTNLPLDQVDWEQVKYYIFERFTTPPASFVNFQGRTLIALVHQAETCEHILHAPGDSMHTNAAWTCHQPLHNKAWEGKVRIDKAWKGKVRNDQVRNDKGRS